MHHRGFLCPALIVRGPTRTGQQMACGGSPDHWTRHHRPRPMALHPSGWATTAWRRPRCHAADVPPRGGCSFFFQGCMESRRFFQKGCPPTREWRGTALLHPPLAPRLFRNPETLCVVGARPPPTGLPVFPGRQQSFLQRQRNFSLRGVVVGGGVDSPGLPVQPTGANSG